MANYAGSQSGTNWQTGLLDELKTAVDATAGWTTVVNKHDDGTYIRSVFKCDYLTDFYFVAFTVTSPVSGTTSVIHSPLLVTACEDYDSTTHKLKRPAVCVSTTLASATDQSASLNWLTLTEVLNNYGVLNFTATSTAITSTTLPWRIIITPETLYFAVRFSGSLLVNGFAMVGFADSLVKQSATNDPSPLVLVCGSNRDSGTSPSADNTYIHVPTAATNNYCNGEKILNTQSIGSTVVLPTRAPLSNGKGTHNWRLDAYPLLNAFTLADLRLTGDVYSESGGTYLIPTIIWRQDETTAATFGLVRGTLDWHTYHWNANAVAAGDSVTAGTRSYYCVWATTNAGFRSRWIREA